MFAVLTFCGKDPEAPASEDDKAASMKSAAEAICNKTQECMQEKFADMPEAQRKMAEKFMPKGEACISQFEASFKRSMDSDETVTNADITKLDDCIAAINDVSCADMEKGPPEACKALDK